jgi:hypothetical protein
MKKFLFGTTFIINILLAAVPAKADIVLFGLSDVLSFRDVGAQGFGDFHRALTLQTNGLEFGARGFGNTQIDQAINGADKGNTPTIGQLGWTSGFNVGIGFNTDQAGQKDGITMQALGLTVWDLVGNPVFTAHLATSPINFSAVALALQQGNGNAVFDFELNAAERAEFNTMLATHPGNALFTVGLNSILGCGPSAPSTCLKADDGPDSFVLFNQQIAAVPETSTWAMLVLGFAGISMFSLRKRRGSNFRMV